MNNKSNKRDPKEGPRIYGFLRSVQKPSIANQLKKLEYQECSHIYEKWSQFVNSFPREGDVLYIYDLDILHRNLKGIQTRVKFLIDNDIELRITRPDAPPMPPIKYSKAVHAAWVRARAKSSKKQTEKANEANRNKEYPKMMDKDWFQSIFTDYLAYVRGEAKGTLKERAKRLKVGVPSYYEYLKRYLINMQEGIWEYPQNINKNVLDDILSRRNIEYDPKTKKWIEVKL